MQHQPSDSKVSEVNKPPEPILAITQHGLWPAQDGPGFSEISKLDKTLPADAKPSRDLCGEAEKGLTIDKARGIKVMDRVVEQVADLTKKNKY